MNELIIYKKDLLHNINVIRSKQTKEDYTFIAVVKGNGYGIGIIELTKFLIENNFNYFAVASMDEALILRKNNIKEKILLLSPYTNEDDLKILIDNDIVLTIDSKECFEIVNKISKQLDKRVYAHIKIDTGLSRYGFNYNDIDSIKEICKENGNLIFEGIYSHLSNSLAKDSSFSYIQFSRFINVLEKLRENNIDFKLKHICNSSGFFKYKDMHLNAARIGSAFIGNAVGIKSDLKKIGLFHTRIQKIRNVNKNDYIGYANSYKVNKPMKIAILPVGYYEGIGVTLKEQRYKFLSKSKNALINFINIFKDNSIYLDKFKVLGQIGMHDVVIDITNLDYKENDDIYFYVRPILIDSSVKREYK